MSGLVGRAYLTRGALLWASIRVLAGVLFVVLDSNPAHVPLIVSASIVSLVFALSYMDLRRRHEKVLLHNLGIPAAFVVIVAAVPAIVGESIIHLAATIGR
jgi:hypothetical protein